MVIEMSITKVKTIVIVFALLLFTGVISAGCKPKIKNSWVNTNSMPGNTFRSHIKNSAKHNNSTIVYLGQDKESQNGDFGPQDVSFKFKDLK